MDLSSAFSSMVNLVSMASDGAIIGVEDRESPQHERRGQMEAEFSKGNPAVP